MSKSAVTLHRTNPEAFRPEYAVMKDGAKIGTVAKKHRPKTAGGPAWAACINESAIPNRINTGSVGVVVYSSSTDKLVEIVEHLVTPSSVAPSHWR
jgi:hypothetical protein